MYGRCMVDWGQAMWWWVAGCWLFKLEPGEAMRKVLFTSPASPISCSSSQRLLLSRPMVFPWLLLGWPLQPLPPSISGMLWESPRLCWFTTRLLCGLEATSEFCSPESSTSYQFPKGEPGSCALLCFWRIWGLFFPFQCFSIFLGSFCELGEEEEL